MPATGNGTGREGRSLEATLGGPDFLSGHKKPLQTRARQNDDRTQDFKKASRGKHTGGLERDGGGRCGWCR